MKIIIRKKNTLVFMLSILPIVDMINGILKYNVSFSIGSIYKIALIFALASLELKNGMFVQRWLHFGGWSIIYIGLVICINNMIGEKTISYEYCIKLIFNIVFAILMMQAVESNWLNGDTLYRILNCNVWLVGICILIPYILGVGSSVYSGAIGYKGFYYSQNELNAILIILFYFCIYKIETKYSFINFIGLGMMGICALLLNTKGGIIACVLGVIILILEMIKSRRTNKWFVIGMVAFALIILKDFILSQWVSFMQRQRYLSDNYGGVIAKVLTSDRISHVIRAWNDLAKDPFFSIKFLLGNGFTTKRIIEMDLIDIFFSMGIIGAIVTVYVYFYFAKKIYSNNNKDNVFIRMLAYLIMVGFSFFAGHVLFMAMSGTYFVLICCFYMTCEN